MAGLLQEQRQVRVRLYTSADVSIRQQYIARVASHIEARLESLPRGVAARYKRQVGWEDLREEDAGGCKTLRERSSKNKMLCLRTRIS